MDEFGHYSEVVKKSTPSSRKPRTDYILSRNCAAHLAMSTQTPEGREVRHYFLDMDQAPGIAPEWRLLIITGFCGGLTTFSTFSAEVVSLLQEGRLGWAAGAIATHVSGSLLMTLLGLFSMNWMLGK